mmetsp:Transcript_29042/g.44622  ORF Transcript_29042/g.44622 Transcript_29042/m.44622 type:complete len:117 (-) Transcript_29042:95-445(-)
MIFHLISLTEVCCFIYFFALEQLFLGYNNLNGTLPTTLGLLTNLEVLHVEFNQLSGTIPTELGNLKKAQVYTFKNNYFQGIMPRSICLQVEAGILVVHLKEDLSSMICSCCTSVRP